MDTRLDDLDTFHRFIAQPAAAVYFSGADCAVCHALKPQVNALFREQFPAIALAEVDCAAASALAAQQGVFSVPTLIVFFDGHEALRYSRNFGIAQLRDALARPYQMFFGD